MRPVLVVPGWRIPGREAGLSGHISSIAYQTAGPRYGPKFPKLGRNGNVPSARSPCLRFLGNGWPGHSDPRLTPYGGRREAGQNLFARLWRHVIHRLMSADTVRLGIRSHCREQTPAPCDKEAQFLTGPGSGSRTPFH